MVTHRCAVSPLVGTDRLDNMGGHDWMGSEMRQCPRCGRNHSGICGIPPGVTLGFGARVGGVSRTGQSQFAAKGKPKSARKGVSVLKKLLEEARIQEKNVAHMMTVIPPELPEFDDLMDRLGKIEKLILQLNQQIIARES